MERYSTEDILHILRIDRRRLLKYRRAVAVCPAGRGKTSSYTFHHLVLLRTAKTLCDAGIPVRRIRSAVQLIQRHIGPARELQSISIAAVGGQVVVTDATGQWRPESGQLLLDYETRAAFKVIDIGGRRSRARASVPPRARDWFEWGLELEQGSPEEARRAYEAALELNPSLTEAHINLGVWHHQAGNLDEAERCYRRALQYDPRCVIAYFNLGLTLEGKGDRQGAIQAHEALLRHEKSHREAHRCLGHLYEAEGRMREALRHYAEARRLSK